MPSLPPGQPVGRLVLRPFPRLAPDALLADVELGRAPVGTDPDGLLHPAELQLAATYSAVRAVAFLGGRAALRGAIRGVAPGRDRDPILRTPRGAPALPAGVAGSISHKRTRAVALATAASTDACLVGLDLEERPVEPPPAGRDLAGRILRLAERDALPAHDALARHEAVLLHFALKEAVYKAIDPLVGRHVRFTEVEVTVHDDGRAGVQLHLPDAAVAGWQLEAWWATDDTHLVAAVAARRR